MHNRWLAVAFAMFAAQVSCYETPKPECGFLCGDDGKCPSGYICAHDNWCKTPAVATNFNHTCEGASTVPDAAVADGTVTDSAPPAADAVPPDAT